MKFSKEFKVGLLAVVSITILYFGFNFLKGVDIFKTTKNYYALYENIDGLTVSNPTIINGMSVGRVSNIQILQKNENLVLVQVSIDSKIELSNGTIARLVNTDFLGSKAIELMLGEFGNGIYNDGDTLKSSVDTGITEFLKQSAGPVADNIGITISRINAILEGFQGNSEKLYATLQNLQSITENLDKKLPLMQDKFIFLLDSLNKNSQNLNEVLIYLKPVLTNAAQFTDSLKTLELSKTLDKTQLMLDNLNSSLVNLKEGKGSLGKLMKDDSLYIYMSHTARDLDLLLVDFKANPGRYVQFSMFGKKDKSKKKNENEKK